MIGARSTGARTSMSRNNSYASVDHTSFRIPWISLPRRLEPTDLATPAPHAIAIKAITAFSFVSRDSVRSPRIRSAWHVSVMWAITSAVFVRFRYVGNQAFIYRYGRYFRDGVVNVWKHGNSGHYANLLNSSQTQYRTPAPSAGGNQIKGIPPQNDRSNTRPDS